MVKPKLLLIEEDTNTILAAALTALKLSIKIGHVEARLRSYDWRMPEEHNRRMTDHMSDMLFAPTEETKKNLESEHVHGEIYVTGNTVIDAVIQQLPMAERKSKIMDKVTFSKKEYALLKVHRAENVDTSAVLENFVSAFIKSPIPIVFPVHPRTMKRLKEYGFLQ